MRITNPVAVGDNVLFEPDGSDAMHGVSKGIITEVLERKNYILRKSSNLSKRGPDTCCKY